MSETKPTFETRADVIEALSSEELQRTCIKVNIPRNMKSYLSGNGEGCWALPLTVEDAKIIEIDKHKEKALVVLCNSSFYFPKLSWASVIQVEMRSGFRPVLDIDWVQEKANHDGVDYIQMLKNNDKED